MAVKTKANKEKSTRGNASQFFVAAELCRRGHAAVVTLGSTPNTDVLCSNLEGTRFVHIQVKTFVPGDITCTVGRKAERYVGDTFFWVLGGIPTPQSKKDFEYYVIPSFVMATNVKRAHQIWLRDKGAKGQERNDSNVRTVHLPPRKSYSGWDISEYGDRWDLIEAKLNVPPLNEPPGVGRSVSTESIDKTNTNTSREVKGDAMTIAKSRKSAKHGEGAQLAKRIVIREAHNKGKPNYRHSVEVAERPSSRFCPHGSTWAAWKTLQIGHGMPERKRISTSEKFRGNLKRTKSGELDYTDPTTGKTYTFRLIPYDPTL